MPYGLVASKLDTTNIFDGCLNVLRKELTTKLPEGKEWADGIGIQGLVGSVGEINEHPDPWRNKSPTWIEIYFGNKWILPFAYSLMGRRIVDANMLKSWEFSGLNKDNKWVLLHSETDKQLKDMKIEHIY